MQNPIFGAILFTCNPRPYFLWNGGRGQAKGGTFLELLVLKLYCDLIETKSFTRAAEINFVTQSAVSQRIGLLEKGTTGQALLERGRGKRKIVPTEAGQVLYEGAKRLLHEAAELDALLRGLTEEIAGTLRVATVYSVGLHALPPRLKPVPRRAPPRQRPPRIPADSTGLRRGAFRRGGCRDRRRARAPAPESKIIPFSQEEMALICATEHPFAARREIALSELEGQPFIAFADDIPTRRLIDARLKAAGVTVRTVMAFDNIETIKNLVEIGSGIALVPADTAGKEAKEGTLAVVPLTPADAFQRPAGLLVKQSGTRRAAVRAFLDAMRQAVNAKKG